MQNGTSLALVAARFSPRADLPPIQRRQRSLRWGYRQFFTPPGPLAPERGLRSRLDRWRRRMPMARRALTYLVKGILVAAVAATVFFTLADSGIIARPSSQIFTIGG